MDGWINEWMNEWINEWMDAWMNGWMNERMNESISSTQQTSWDECLMNLNFKIYHRKKKTLHESVITIKSDTVRLHLKSKSTVLY